MDRQKAFNISIFILLLFCLCQMVTSKNIEITSEEIFNLYRHFSFITFSLLLALVAIFSSEDVAGQFIKLVSIIGICLATLYWLVLMLFFSFEFTSTKVLYVSKTEPNSQIIQKTIYGGAVTDDYFDTVIIKQLTQNIRWIKALDKKTIDYNNWIVVTK